jgi:hypothetical protein
VGLDRLKGLRKPPSATSYQPYTPQEGSCEGYANAGNAANQIGKPKRPTRRRINIEATSDINTVLTEIGKHWQALSLRSGGGTSVYGASKGKHAAGTGSAPKDYGDDAEWIVKLLMRVEKVVSARRAVAEQRSIHPVRDAAEAIRKDPEIVHEPDIAKHMKKIVLENPDIEPRELAYLLNYAEGTIRRFRREANQDPAAKELLLSGTKPSFSPGPTSRVTQTTESPQHAVTA